jgi:hypothetical protein
MPNIRHYSAFVKIFYKKEIFNMTKGLFDYIHMLEHCKSDIKHCLNKVILQLLKRKVL